MHWNAYAYELIAKDRIGTWWQEACYDRLARVAGSRQARQSAVPGWLARLLGARSAAPQRSLAAVGTKPCGATGDGRAA